MGDERKMMMKRIYSALIAIFVVAGCVCVPVGAVGTSATAAILMEADSGRILYENNMHQQSLIASITKLMTALVAAEMTDDLEETFVVAPESCGIEGSSIYLRPAEEITMEALLHGVLLNSGNDAAMAVAIQCGGTQEAFVARMNDRAQSLGMENTHFANPNGLDAEGHHSTAYDMALLAQECLKNEDVARIAATKSAALGGRVFYNHNKLLWKYEGCVGMKTGYTERAGRTLISAAERDGMRLIAVTLNDGNDWHDHAELLDYGFEQWQNQTLCEQGDVMAQIPVTGGIVPFVDVVTGEGATYPVDNVEQVTHEIILHSEYLVAPVVAGGEAGTIVYSMNDEIICEVPLLYNQNITNLIAPEQGWIQRLLSRFF